MITSGMGLVVYLGLAFAFMGPLQAGGIALANSLSYSIQALFLLLVLNKGLPVRFQLGNTLLRSIIGALIGGSVTWLITRVLPLPVSGLILAVGGMTAGAIVAALPIWREIKTLAHL